MESLKKYAVFTLYIALTSFVSAYLFSFIPEWAKYALGITDVSLFVLGLIWLNESIRI
jgi:hypothetical protein